MAGEQTIVVSPDSVDLSEYATETTTDPVQQMGGIFDALDQSLASESHTKHEATKLAKLRSLTQDTNFFDEYETAYTQLKAGANSEEMQDNDKIFLIDKADEQLRAFIKDNATSDDPEVRQSVADVMGNFNEFRNNIVEELLDVDGTESAITEALASESLDDLRKRQETAQAHAMNTVAQWAEDTGAAGTAWDFTTYLFSFDAFKDSADLTGTGEFSDMEGLADFVQTFQQLDPQEQTVVFEDTVFPRIVEAYDGNTFKVQAVVSLLYSREFSEEVLLSAVADGVGLVTLPFDVAALGKLGIRAAKAAKGSKAVASLDAMRTTNAVKSSRSVAKRAQKLGNDTVAAQAVAAAAMDAKAADIVGMTRADAISSVSPFRRLGTEITGSVDNLADTLSRTLNKSVESRISDIMHELKLTRKGISKEVARKAEIDAVEIPKKIAQLEDEIRILGNVARPKNLSKAAKNARAQILIKRDQLKVLRDTPIVRSVEDINQELMQLRAGITPRPLAKAISEAIEQEHTLIAAAQATVRPAREALENAAEVLNKATGSNIGDAAVQSRMSELSVRVLDNPESLGISKEYAKTIEEATRVPIAQVTKDIKDATPELLRAERRAAVKTRVTDKIIKEAERHGDDIRDAVITDMKGNEGFTVTYNRGGNQEALTYKYTVNDAGMLEGTADLKPSLRESLSKVLSPETLFHDFKGLVDGFTFKEGLSARVGNKLQNIHKNILKGLSTADKADLNSLLLAGDDNARVFTLTELEAGIAETTLSIKPHNAKVINAYYNMRGFLDEMHSARNQLIRKELEMNGHRNFSYIDELGDTREFMGRPLDSLRGKDLEDQRSIFMPNGIAAGDSKYIPMASMRAQVDTWLDEGYQIIEMYDPHILPEGGSVKYALVSDGFGVKMSDLPAQVLNYKDGYVPRIYRRGYYFVKDTSTPAHPATLFAAETRADANAIRSQMMAADDSLVLTVRGDREISKAEKMAIDAESYGGLYTGRRKQTNLMLRNAEGELKAPERVSSGDAVQRYMYNLANLMPMPEYRSMRMKQWQESVRFLAEAEGLEKGLADPTDFFSEVLLSPETKNMMEITREYLFDQLRLATPDEKVFNKFLQRAGDSLYKGKDTSKGADLARHMMYGLMDKDPVSALKGLTFNMQLGGFNVRQVLVQVQNAAIATAVSPKHSLGAVADALEMRAAALSTDPAVWRQAAKVAGRNEDEFVEAMRAMQKSGVMDSIKQIADFDASVVSTGGHTVSGLRKAAQAGRIFFNEGELMSRLISWNIARRTVGPKAPVKEVFDEYLRVGMNMQSANAATWQKNWLGIPLQYMQVFTKFYERLGTSLIYGRDKGVWTKGEAGRVLAWQLGLYGTVGIPVAEEAYAFLAEQQGKTPKQVQEEMPHIQEMFDEGLVGTLASVMGVENNFSKDFSLLSGTADNTISDMAVAFYDGFGSGTSDVDAYQLLLGPSGTTVRRFADLGTQLAESVRILKADVTLDQLGTQALRSLDALGGLTSTWSGARKAIFLHDVGITSRKGNQLIAPEQFKDVNFQTMAARAMNFETDIETAYWNLKETNRNSKKHEVETMSALKMAHLQLIKDNDMVAYKSNVAWLLTGYTPTERRRLTANLQKGLTGDSDYDRQAKRHLENFVASGGRIRLQPTSTAQ